MFSALTSAYKGIEKEISEAVSPQKPAKPVVPEIESHPSDQVELREQDSQPAPVTAPARSSQLQSASRTPSKGRPAPKPENASEVKAEESWESILAKDTTPTKCATLLLKIAHLIST